VCAVHRCAVGVACCDQEDRDEFFESAFATPDLVIGSNFPCASESKSFLQVVHKYDTPYYFVDTPINTWGREIPEHAVKYYAGQLQGMVDFLVSHGYVFDTDRLKQEVAFTKSLNTLLEEIETYRQAIPLPIKAYDSVIAATAPLALPKEMRKLEYFERLRDELKERVEKGIGIVSDEKLRLLWIGIPPLCDFKLLDYTERYDTVVAKSMLEFLTGFTLDADMMDPEVPLESIARAQLSSPANPTIQGMTDYFVRAAKDYRVDGVISVVKRTCGYIPGIQRLIKEAIYESTGAPSIVFDLDGVDEREYDREAIVTNLDAFVETLLARKGG
jgi:benzoyl-CoA reductase/2-hydroxyglutaryl-CoA dehydratase subunit BcrC/BadD/HgdB